MQIYNKIIYSYSSFSSARMLIGASSTIYMLASELTLYDVGVIKSWQALLILIFGFFISLISDRNNRKFVYLYSLFFATLWLYFMYLGGIDKNIYYFYIAEFFNALSLCLYQNNSNAYLIDQVYRENPKQDLKQPLGKLNRLGFLGMAISSILGGVLYYYFSADLFLYTAFLIFLVLLFSIFLLPTMVNKKHSHINYLEKKEFLLIFRKFAKYKIYIIVFLLLNVYFQVIIQYWQPLIMEQGNTVKKEYLFGVVLFLMMLSQSFAGKWIENYPPLSLKINLLLFLTGLILSLFQSLLLLTAGLCLILFSIRYIVIYTDSQLHRDLLSCFRAKYDMVLNTILRILSALSLFLIGYFSEQNNIVIIIYLGICIAIISLFFSVKLKNKDAKN